MAKCLKATLEQLMQHVRSNSTGLGQSFELLCRYCRDAGSISADSRTFKSEVHRTKAAEKFAKQAWRIEGGLPVCPTCFLRRFEKGKYTQEDIT